MDLEALWELSVSGPRITTTKVRYTLLFVCTEVSKYLLNPDDPVGEYLFISPWSGLEFAHFFLPRSLLALESGRQLTDAPYGVYLTLTHEAILLLHRLRPHLG